MKPFVTRLVAVLAVALPSFAFAADWTLDPAHSSASFRVQHLLISEVEGDFKTLEGKVSYDPATPEKIAIEAVIDAASVDTRIAKRDEHLRSADFFDVANHPKITFKSKSAKKKGKVLEVKGDLTLRGKTKPVTLTVEGLDKEVKDPWGALRRGGRATTKIDRTDFDVKFNAPLEAGGMMIGDEVKIVIDFELIKQADAKTAEK